MYSIITLYELRITLVKRKLCIEICGKTQNMRKGGIREIMKTLVKNAAKIIKFSWRDGLDCECMAIKLILFIFVYNLIALRRQNKINI